MENRSVMIVFRQCEGFWWRAWDGTRHYTDTLNFKNSLWNCMNDVGRIANQVGLVFIDEEAYGVQDNPTSFRPVEGLDIEVISKGFERFDVLYWKDIPRVLHNRVLNDVPFSTKQLQDVEFNLNDPNQFLVWLDIKMFGIGAPSPEGSM